jgi:hypothetical protein
LLWWIYFQRWAPFVNGSSSLSEIHRIPTRNNPHSAVHQKGGFVAQKSVHIPFSGIHHRTDSGLWMCVPAQRIVCELRSYPVCLVKDLQAAACCCVTSLPCFPVRNFWIRPSASVLWS